MKSSQRLRVCALEGGGGGRELTAGRQFQARCSDGRRAKSEVSVSEESSISGYEIWRRRIVIVSSKVDCGGEV